MKRKLQYYKISRIEMVKSMPKWRACLVFVNQMSNYHLLVCLAGV